VKSYSCIAKTNRIEKEKMVWQISYRNDGGQQNKNAY